MAPRAAATGRRGTETSSLVSSSYVGRVPRSGPAARLHRSGFQLRISEISATTGFFGFDVMRALAAFGAPMRDITEADFSRPGVTYQIGVVPGRIDILTELTSVTFAEAWPDRIRRPFGTVDVDFIGRDAFIRNRRPTGRPKDLGDIEGLE